MGIVVVGTTYVDVKGYPDSEFIMDGRNAGSIQIVHGGVGRNIAENIANCGVPSVFVSVIDQSPLSHGISEHLASKGVDTDHVKACENGLGTWMAIFNNDGDVVASISKRPDLSGILTELKAEGDAIFSRADSIVVEIDIDKPILDAVFHYAEAYKKRVFAVVSNMSIALTQPEYLGKTACFVCNLQEAGMLFDEDLGGVSLDTLAEAMPEKIAAQGLTAMVVTAGEKGAAYADLKTGISGTVPAGKVEVVDTTGAGDAYLSGVSIGLTYGLPLGKACGIGTILASSAISTKGNVCSDISLDKYLGSKK